MKRKKILMAMVEVGFGHKAPAIAVKDAIEASAPGAYELKIVDFVKESGAKVSDRAMKATWDLALAFPLSARIGYLLVELNHKIRDKYIDAMFRTVVEKGIAYIARQKPDLVFATHPMCLFIAAKARERLGLAFKVVGYVVDPFDGYSWWAEQGADMLLAATERSREQLLRHGISESKIRIIPYPVSGRFLDIGRSRDETLAALGLDPARPTVLASAGAQGIGKIYSWIEALAILDLPLNLIVVSGRNKLNKRRMDMLAASPFHPSTKIASLGYVTNMNELASASDALAGKAGAATAMEAIFLEKPFVFTEWASYNDRYIINFSLDYEIGWYAPNLFSFVRVMRSIVEGSALAKRSENLKRLGMKPGTEEVAAFLRSMID